MSDSSNEHDPFILCWFLFTLHNVRTKRDSFETAYFVPWIPVCGALSHLRPQRFSRLIHWFHARRKVDSCTKIIRFQKYLDSCGRVYISEFTQQDGRKKRTAKRLCVSNVTGLLLACFVMIFT